MRKKLLTGLLCTVLFIANVIPTGIQVQASELEQQDSITETNVIEEDVTEEDSEEDTNIGKDDIAETESDVDEETDVDEENDAVKEGNIEGSNEDSGEGNNTEGEEDSDAEADEEQDEKQDVEDIENVDEDLVTEETEADEETEELAEQITEEDIKSEVEELEGKIKTSSTDIASGSYENISWVIDANGKLTVEGTGDFARTGTYENRAPWYNYRTAIVSADINVSGMTDASYMFFMCENLTSIDMSDFDTSNTTNMRNMFAYCSSISQIDVSGFNTGNAVYMDGIFWGCSSLESLDVSNWNTDKATTMEDMFCGCKSLTKLDVSNFGTSNVTHMSGMFWGCSSLSTINVSNFNTSKVQYMDAMFLNCSNLTELSVKNFNTTNVTTMGNMFSGCSSLKQLDVSNFVTDNVTGMGGMFGDCSGLTELNVSNFNTNKVTAMNGMFSGCSGLNELNVSSFNTSNVYDMSDMFSYCSNLKELNVGNFNTSNVTQMSGMFSGCSSLTELNLSNFNTSNVEFMAMMFWGCSNLRKLDLSSFDLGNIEAIWDMFGNCTNLSTIYTPCNLTQSVALPTAKSSDVWYRSDGTKITELPQNMSYSIMIAKNKKPVIPDPYITITKTKTAYSCGENINVDDITVTYYNSQGTSTKITEGYTTNVEEIDMSTPGKKELKVTYQNLTAIVELTVTYSLKADAITISLPVTEFVYSGQEKKPIPTITINATGDTLVSGKDYTVSYENNVNAGTVAKVIVTGQNDYSGSIEKNFTIKPATVVITAKDMICAIGEPLPKKTDYKYLITGLVAGDKLVSEPSFTCAVSDMSKIGTYKITPHSADAGTNYTISYLDGTLTVAEERVVYNVTFNLLGHGTEINVLTGVKAGSLINEPTAPTEEGYTFVGWYKDKACTKVWNFAVDTVQEDTVLYACWIVGATDSEENTNLCLQDIQDQTYTGSALKPSIRVYSSDGNSLLKAGKDYTIKYYNNTTADTEDEVSLGGISKSGDEGDNGFTKSMAYVAITGKGNYKGTVYRNFHIAPISVGDEDENIASGITLKFNEQMVVNTKKAQKPFVSLKYKKNMKVDTDFKISLTTLNAFDEEGNVLAANIVVDTSSTPAIPAGYTGTFQMKITGINNYTGTISKTIYVSDKTHLMKNASITLGKSIKNIAYTGSNITLTPAYYDASTKKYYVVESGGSISQEAEPNANNVYTVKFGKEYLVYGRDFTVSYANNQAVGTATMTITGIGDYTGSKSVTFRINGTAFNTRNISISNFKTSLAYTGEPLRQNEVVLTAKDGTELEYGQDYTISYKNNQKKGTATMQFTAKTESGYSGSFKKTFRITTTDLNDAVSLVVADTSSGDKIVFDEDDVTLVSNVIYVREGAKPIDKINLVNKANGAILKSGTDYTVSYANNKAVTTDATSKLPTMTIKGKGNYSGTLKITFTINEASMQLNDNLKVTASATNFNVKKADTYQYQPKIKVTDKKQTLRVKKDYTITYKNCTQAEVKAYLTALADATTSTSTLESMKPQVVITAVDGSGYEGTITEDLTIYQTKLTTGNLYVVISEEKTTYTGKQVTPEVTVYYGDVKAIKLAKKAKEINETILTDNAGTYKLVKLNLQENGNGDYTLIYGTNVTAGKNKGTVTVVGTGLYGGSVATKFTIQSRDVYTVK